MREPLSYDIAHRAAEAALAAARAEGARVCVVVANRSGDMKVLLSADGAGRIALETARRKAYTAAVMGMSSTALAALAADQTMAAIKLDQVDSELLPVAGGHPILVEDRERIGGIGVSGAHGDADDRLAEEGLKAIASLLA